jgi:hypothetical protein
MRSRVRFPALPWGFFSEGEDSHGDHGLGGLVELKFKAPPGSSYSYITHRPLHRDNVTAPHGRPNLRRWLHFGHNREGDHEVHKRRGGIGKKNCRVATCFGFLRSHLQAVAYPGIFFGGGGYTRNFWGDYNRNFLGGLNPPNPPVGTPLWSGHPWIIS